MDYIRVINKGCCAVVVLLNLGCCQLVEELSSRPQSPLIGDWVYKNNRLGKMVLTFKNDNTYEVDFTADGQADIWGRFELRKNRLRMDYEDALHLTDCYTPGIYTIEISKGELFFDEVADQCIPRKMSLKISRVRKPKG